MSSYVAIIAVLVGVVAAVYFATSSTEGFWNLPSRTWKVERVESVQTPDGPDFYQTPGFQGILSPRFSNVNYGSYIRTKLPDYAMMGVPSDPLGGNFGGSFNAANSGPKGGKCNVVEGFTPSNKQRDTVDNPSGYTNGNYKQVVSSLAVPEPKSQDAQSASFLTADGEMKQPIVYDRYVYANRHSRLRAQGDWFRGDLPIVPNSGNWFVPSVHPNIDLNAGAINVMAGVNNDTSKQLANLIYNSSGGGDTTIGGVDMRSGLAQMNMTNQNRTATVAAGGDVTVTSFP